MRIGVLVLGLIVLFGTCIRLAEASSWNPAILVNTQAFQVIDDSDTGSDVSIKFGDTISKSLIYERALTRFKFDDDLIVVGDVNATGTLSGKSLRVVGTGGITTPIIMTVTGSARVGIGTSTPKAKLAVVGTISGTSLKIDDLSSSGGLLFGRGSANNIAQTAKGASGQVLVSRGGATPMWGTPTSSLVWYIDGNLSVAANQGAIVKMPIGFTVTSVTLRVKGSPVGSALIVNIKRAGTTIFSTKPQVNAGSTIDSAGAVLSTTNIPATSEMTVDIDQVGSTFAGSGLTIMLNGTRKY